MVTKHINLQLGDKMNKVELVRNNVYYPPVKNGNKSTDASNKSCSQRTTSAFMKKGRSNSTMIPAPSFMNLPERMNNQFEPEMNRNESNLHLLLAKDPSNQNFSKSSVIDRACDEPLEAEKNLKDNQLEAEKNLKKPILQRQNNIPTKKLTRLTVDAVTFIRDKNQTKLADCEEDIKDCKKIIEKKKSPDDKILRAKDMIETCNARRKNLQSRINVNSNLIGKLLESLKKK